MDPSFVASLIETNALRQPRWCQSNRSSWECEREYEFVSKATIGSDSRYSIRYMKHERARIYMKSRGSDAAEMKLAHPKPQPTPTLESIQSNVCNLPSSNAVSTTQTVGQPTDGINPKPKRKPKGYWNEMDNVLKELKQFMEEYGFQDRMPTHTEFIAYKRSDLTSAIRRQGGFEKIAAIASIRPTSLARPRSLYLTYAVNLKSGRLRPHNYWKSFSNVSRELETFMQEHGLSKLPTSFQLERADRSDLVRAIISHHGGMESVARKMNIAFRYHSKGYWKDVQTVKKELDLLCTEFGLCDEMPSVEMLKQLGPPGLNTAIVHHGGRIKVAELLGYKTQRKSKTYWSNLENIVAEMHIFILQHDSVFRIGKEPVGTGSQESVKPKSRRSVNNAASIVENQYTHRMPLKREMIELGRGDLSQAITRHASSQVVAERLNLQY